MDEDFLRQLDEALTNVGSDKYWERKIGGHVVWLSPVPFKSQHKINELLANENLGPNVIGEVKRMTMAYSIVGFDGFDLRPYRDESPKFKIYDHREKKNVKVALHKYLYGKIEDWGTEWVDSAFEVFADILETIRKENLKEIKFDNAKDSKEELAELEEKVRDLRDELGMPPLVELDMKSAEPRVDALNTVPAPAPTASVETQPEEPEFNPFRKIPTEAVPNSSSDFIQDQNPSISVIQDQVKHEIIDSHVTTSTADNPYIGSGRSDIIEQRSNREAANLEIDQTRPQSVNPRFKRSSG